MMMSIVSIYDHVAKVYSRPVFVQSEAAAIRSFSDQVNNAEPNNELYRHAGDFDLFCLGQFDDSNGEFKVQLPALLVKASQVKEV